MRNKWLRVLKSRCNILDWIESRICSKHFELKCFDSQRKLKENAVPTLFTGVSVTKSVMVIIILFLPIYNNDILFSTISEKFCLRVKGIIGN